MLVLLGSRQQKAVQAGYDGFVADSRGDQTPFTLGGDEADDLRTEVNINKYIAQFIPNSTG